MRKTPDHRKRIFIYVLLAAIFVLFILLFRQAGQWLVQHNELKQADALVILTGSTGDRAQHAADLYHSGLTPLILIVHDYEAGKDYFAARNIYLPNAAEITRDLLVQLDVPDSLIILLPAQARSTRDEAQAMITYLQQHPETTSLLLVSSASHTRRSMIIFHNHFHRHKLQTELISAPSPYTGFKEQRWWKHRESAKDVFNEYTKLLWFLLVERWS
jgi:uncharacterized SAM-binding protein YcdF (DUF218 family)